MPKVNYVREHTRFIEYATDEHLTSSERLLWYALMHIMNQRAQGNVWPEEFIRISNDRLLTYCGMKYDTMAQARNGLKQRGLIEFTRGEKNKLSPAYRMIYFFPEYIAPATEDDAESYPEKSDYMGGNPGDNMGGNMGGNQGGYMGDYSINYTKRNHEPNVYEEDEQDEEAYAHARAEACAAWRESFGRDAYPAALNRLAGYSVCAGFGSGVLRTAIQAAAEGNTASPMDYIMKLLEDWKRHGALTEADVARYTLALDASKGRVSFMTRREGIDELMRFDAGKKGGAGDATA